MYKRINERSADHVGSGALRGMLADFHLGGPHGEHRCLVHEPLSESVIHFLHRNPIGRLPSVVLAVMLRRLFEALDFLHTRCQIIHTDIKADNIMFGVRDNFAFKAFEELEIKQPCARKVFDDRTIYESRPLATDAKGLAPPVLCDLGSAVLGDVEHLEDVQPDNYRSPEVILEMPWTHSVDIWNAGCMIWDIFKGGHLFFGHDDELQKYRGRAHIADIVALLGPPPKELLARGRSSHRFFREEGTFCDDVPHRERTSLEERETTLEGEDKAMFLRFMRKMLQWEPEKRATAAELIHDEWIDTHYSD